MKTTAPLFRILWTLAFFMVSSMATAQCADTSDTGDCDGDGVLNGVDLDDDNDGILDTDEGLNRIVVNNNGFESHSGVPAGRYRILNESDVDHWLTNATDNKIEIWADTFLGVPAYEGSYFAELNANEVASLYQDIEIQPGTTVIWSIAHRGRLGEDVASLSVGPPGKALTVIETMRTGNQAWQVYTGTYTVPLGQTTTRFSLNSSAAQNLQSYGNLMDAFSLETQGVDSDQDGIMDYYDRDSDNDGCFDALEGDAGLLSADLLSDGSISGGVDANGVPVAVSAGQAQGTGINPGSISDECASPDTDGDGVEDVLDDYPNEPNKAADSFYPSKEFNGTLAYEDLWPFVGDYDFNDTAISYNINQIYNANNQIVEVQIEVTLENKGGVFTNGFAFEFDDLSPADIASVSGQQLSLGLFSTDTNGTELGQSNAVVPVFDNDEEVLDQLITITIVLSQPMETVGTDPFDPFIVANNVREMEIHLVGNDPTDLGNATPTVEGNNADPDGNYATDNGLPWAINIVDKIPLPIEKTAINEGYKFFIEWAQSGGSLKADWYEDKNGYRTAGKLDLNQN